jgi:hypothetical protein
LHTADHGKLNRRIKPTLGFKSMKTAYATIRGFELMHALRKGQAKFWMLSMGVRGEVRLLERTFGVGPSIMTAMIQRSLLSAPLPDIPSPPPQFLPQRRLEDDAALAFILDHD